MWIENPSKRPDPLLRYKISFKHHKKVLNHSRMQTSSVDFLPFITFLILPFQTGIQKLQSPRTKTPALNSFTQIRSKCSFIKTSDFFLFFYFGFNNILCTGIKSQISTKTSQIVVITGKKKNSMSAPKIR